MSIDAHIDPRTHEPGSNPRALSGEAEGIGAIIETRLTRRDALKGLLAGGATVALATGMPRRALAQSPSTLRFTELEHGYDETHHVAKDHVANVLIRWGDPVVPGAPDFDPMNQTAEAQLKQFGYNNDFIGFMPLPLGTQNASRGLLCVNHEYTNAELMFPGMTQENFMDKMTKDQVDVDMAAHGHTVIEIAFGADGQWRVVPDSRYNRRITALSTPMELTGPAAGSERVKTKGDPTGRIVIGTVNNCAGGTTPWGTVLFAEENFNFYFGGDPKGTPQEKSYARLGINGKPGYPWYKFHERFDITKEPNEPNRFGWMVEYDPYDPNSVPKKRTSLGRFKHEGATVAINKDGRVVVYSGDDERFDYVYRFVSNGRFDPNNRAANMRLLDDGELSVAKFNADGSLEWLPLVHGQGKLTAENGFNSQADVLIDARRAGDLVGATPMDRPEDVEPNPVSGTIFVMLTNNTRRKPEQVDSANPRPDNKHGHILEMIPPGGRGADADHTAAKFTWSIFLLAGDPSKDGDKAVYHPATTENGWLSCPDNCAFDAQGRLWIATDGAPSTVKIADGVWATDVDGAGRALTRHFMRAPRGAEVCGPMFTPDSGTFFCAIQHPADEKGSTFDTPSTRWPDFYEGMPPRPSVLTIRRRDGEAIG